LLGQYSIKIHHEATKKINGSLAINGVSPTIRVSTVSVDQDILARSINGDILVAMIKVYMVPLSFLASDM